MDRAPDSMAAGASPAPAGRPDQRLPRTRRLSPALYRATFDANRSFPGRLLVLWLRRAPDADRRVGVVASRRAFPTAVGRNRARRLLREAFRLNRLHLSPDADLVLVARQRMAGCGLADVAGDFERTCRRAGIWRGQPC